MSTIRNRNRQFIAVPFVCTSTGNLGTLAYEQEIEKAAKASERLLRRLYKAGATFEPSRERPRRSFEEQLALVQTGRARVVEKSIIPRSEHQYTLGGVNDWAAL